MFSAFVVVEWGVVQELCEGRGGRPGLSVLMSLLVSVDVKAVLNHASALVSACPCQPASEDTQQHYLPNYLFSVRGVEWGGGCWEARREERKSRRVRWWRGGEMMGDEV